ncbi:MAG: S9 family peptidase [Porphyromonadaceae bacterium]|nr:S9 family peptidase [Porphyromonadaceae bacterium]
MMQSDFPSAPTAEIIPDSFTNFGVTRIDNYFWMKDKNNPKVIDYLNAENAYTDSVMSSTKQLQEDIYNEIIGRIKEDDETYPTLNNGYYYYTRSEKGKQYRVYCRKKGSLDAPEEIFFDVNKMAEGKTAYIFGGHAVSPDNSMSAYFYNETGSFADYTLKIKNLNTGKELDFTVKGATSFAWANDNKTVFYGIIDPVTLRPYQIYRQEIDKKDKVLVYEEKDVKFRTGVSGSKTKDWIIISSGSSTTSETRFASADNPTEQFNVVLPRVQDVEYSVYPHKEFFFIRYKDKENLNGKVYQVGKADYADRNAWKEIIPHNEEVRIESLGVQKDYLIIETRKNGLAELEIREISSGKSKSVTFPEPVYNAYSNGNPEYHAATFRYGYTSLNRPTTLYEYDCTTDKSTVLKVQEVPSGFNPNDYKVERIWATASDGVQVPISIVYKKNLKKNGKNPALLYAYGSYGMSMNVFFSSSFYSLIDRGFVFGIAHIRGGSDMGEQWYEDGKLMKKKNTFTDFIACSEKLIADKYTSADKLAAMGGSAGGLLMGAVANMRPELYQTIVSQVPFVDVVSTMLDDTLPLTTGEYEEWGNPNEEEAFNYILSYSPYDNIKAQNYPNMLITGGINDSQVLFHEPTKYAAKLRSMKTDDNIVLLKINMDSGHGGATGRYDGIKETAFELAFILNRVGIDF